MLSLSKYPSITVSFMTTAPQTWTKEERNSRHRLEQQGSGYLDAGSQNQLLWVIYVVTVPSDTRAACAVLKAVVAAPPAASQAAEATQECQMCWALAVVVKNTGKRLISWSLTRTSSAIPNISISLLHRQHHGDTFFGWMSTPWAPQLVQPSRKEEPKQTKQKMTAKSGLGLMSCQEN